MTPNSLLLRSPRHVRFVKSSSAYSGATRLAARLHKSHMAARPAFLGSASSAIRPYRVTPALRAPLTAVVRPTQLTKYCVLVLLGLAAASWSESERLVIQLVVPVEMDSGKTILVPVSEQD